MLQEISQKQLSLQEMISAQNCEVLYQLDNKAVVSAHAVETVQ